jgi:hypothetical protein
MLRSLPVPLAILASVLMLGCGEQPAPSEPVTTPRPSFRTERNPDGPGARIFRFDDLFFFVIVDFQRGLTTVLGATPEEHLAACQSGIPPEEASFKEVVRPGDVHKFLVKGAAMGVTIWPAASGDICGELMAVPFLAGGTARVRYTDNDVQVSGTRANSYGVRAHGTVTSLASGEEFKLLAKYQAIIFRNGEFRETISEIRLR